MTKTNIARVLVGGDCFNDWNLAHTNGSDGYRAADMHCAPGGSAHLACLLGAFAEEHKRAGKSTFDVVSADYEAVSRDPDCLASYQILSRIKGHRDASPVWRVSERTGYSADPVDPETAKRQSAYRVADTADIVVLDDSNLGFRDNPDAWPGQLANLEQVRWIVHKMVRPVAHGKLWDVLDGSRNKVVAVFDIDDLRSAGVLISRGISWERTCEELAWEITYSPDIGALAKCAFVVVNIPYCGAFLYANRRSSAGSQTTRIPDVDMNLVVDPRFQEGQWEQGRPGQSLSSTAVLTATIARELVREPASPDLERGIKSGLAAARRAHEIGYTSTGKEGGLKLSLQYEQIVSAAVAGDEPFWTATIPAPWDEGFKKDWTLLETNSPGDLLDRARVIVRQGLDEGLKGVPVLSFGFLQTVDRSEIEGYNAINNIIGNYLKGKASQPLSIAVYGPPGAGKSFGIKQISKSIGGDSIKVVEFNLSQYNGPEELHSAFHVVRDIGLSGKIPLVFWDEFDSALGPDKPLFWLKYFLMPMQDGEFRKGDLTHPIGRSIFIFAGGTKSTFQDFCTHADMTDTDYKNFKGPDFVSRLKGHINVLGPNPRGGDRIADRFYVVRRAILLRSMITRNSKGIVSGGMVNIDDGILSAFLETETFKHGARSMESIISMSSLEGKDQYERSSLPTPEQMSAHVDPESFIDIVQQQILNDEILDRMAAAVHEKVYGKNATAPLAESSFDELAEEYKHSCREFVRSINGTLREVGCVLVPRRGKVPRLRLPHDLLEELAEREHERWNRERRASNWRTGYPKQEPPECVSPYIVPWAELPERIREHDRSYIVNIPTVLAPSGYTIRDVTSRTDSPHLASVSARSLRIGVSGHRVLDDTKRTRIQIREALESVRERWSHATVEVVSPLAEGADRLVAHVVLEQLGGTLRVPLPLPEDEYKKDFRQPGSVDEFDALLARARQVITLPKLILTKEHAGVSSGNGRVLAYRQAGEFVLDDCDLLIAVWDGEETGGIGGTHEIVARARERRHPLVWLDTSDGGKRYDENLP